METVRAQLHPLQKLPSRPIVVLAGGGPRASQAAKKGEAKGRIVAVRFTGNDLRAIAAKAKASKQTVSEWIRSTLNAAIQ